MAKYEVDGTGAKEPDNDNPFLRLVKGSITPDVSGGESISPDNSKKRDHKVIDFNEAKKRLTNSESGASKEGVGDSTGGLDGVRDKESKAGGFYSGVGKPTIDTNGKKKGKGFLRRSGPMAAIFGLILGVGGFMVGGQALMPFSLLEQFKDTFDSISVVNNKRANVFFGKQLEAQELKNPIHQKYFGFGDNTFKVHSSQKNKLKKQGIYVTDKIDFGTGKKQSVMLFDDGSGKLKVVTAGNTDVDISKIDLSKIDADVDISKMEIDGTALDFKNAFKNIPDFRNGYINASRTWRGSVGAWFDSITLKFLESNKLTRNRFRDWQERVRAEQEGNTKSATKKKAAVDTMKANQEELEMETKKYDFENETDQDGKTKVKTNDDGGVNPADVETKKIKFGVPIKNQAEIKQKLADIKEGKLGKASGAISAAVNVVCTVFDVIGAINLLLVAQETLQIIQLTTSYFEAIDKVKAGDGDGSPINVLAEGLTTPKSTTVMKNSEEYENKVNSMADLSNGGISTSNYEKLNNENDENIQEFVATGKENTTAMQSSGISALYSGTAVDANDESVQNFNIGQRFNTILGYLGNAGMSFAACAIAKAAAALAGAVMDVVSIVGCALSLGLGCAAQALVDAGISLGTNIAIAGAAQVAINVITPLALKIFTRDLISDLAGEDLGNALTSGANIYMGNNHLHGGGSLASYNKYIGFVKQQEEVIAEKARFERETKSPFDVSSQHTFMGNLVKQMATMYTIKSPIFGTIGTVSKMVSNSVVTLLPSASAYDITSTVKPADDPEFSTNCPFLASINAVGDAFCNPYMVTDASTIDSDPLEVVDDVEDLDGLTSDGDIKENSNLAKYIAYCSQRNSSFGVADGNIASDFASLDVNTGNAVVDTTSNSVIGAVPVVGDLVDVFNNTKQLANTGWITGQSCVASGDSMDIVDDNGDTKTLGVSWEQNKHYQRYVEDQRLLESMNPDYESPVNKFLAAYYEKHPLDNSYEGILARKSGLTKETVVALIDTMEYWDYVAKYNPSERYAFGMPTVRIENGLKFDDEDQVSGSQLAVLIDRIIYADVRNRNFVV